MNATLRKPAPTAMEAALRAEAESRGAPGARALRGLPHRRIDEWRWTDFRAVLKEPIPFACGNGVDGAPVPGSDQIDGVVIRFAGGAPQWDDASLDGVAVRLAEGGDVAPALSAHPMALTATALSEAVLTIEVAPGAEVSAPVILDFSASGTQVHAQVRLVLGEGARATLVERYAVHGGAFLNVAIDARIGAGARLERCIVQTGDAAAALSSVAALALGARSSLVQSSLLTGARIARLETRLDFTGAEAKAEIGGGSLIASGRHGDATSHITHAAPGCITRQRHRAAVCDQGRAVFQGKFLVNRAGQKTDADMQANALLLHDGAEANHKPELEIYADDVACAHGSTAGALDESALFYLRQRGLSAAEARALLIEAFVGEVFDPVTDPKIEAAFRKLVSAWLTANAA